MTDTTSIRHPTPLTSGDFTAAEEPFALFGEWFAEAVRAEPNDPNAMSLATVDANGLPDMRMVLMKGYDAGGFVFYSHIASAKGSELAANPKRRRYCATDTSLAIVYQELLTGHRPFSGSNVRQLILQHLQAAPDLSSLPEDEQPIIARRLAKNPDDRFPNCQEMVKGLRQGGAPAQRNGEAHGLGTPGSADGPGSDSDFS